MAVLLSQKLHRHEADHSQHRRPPVVLATGDHRLHTERPDETAVLVVVIAEVTEQMVAPQNLSRKRPP
ncbi:hypothetical protein [Streptomyces sp. NPDC058545]|uniref:hypothetical protein n=1 Tax=Streptomyces sp. NPDC058545 TaxID=3346544 RepID=UPI00365E24E2